MPNDGRKAPKKAPKRGPQGQTEARKASEKRRATWKMQALAARLELRRLREWIAEQGLRPPEREVLERKAREKGPKTRKT